MNPYDLIRAHFAPVIVRDIQLSDVLGAGRYAVTLEPYAVECVHILDGQVFVDPLWRC